MYSWNKGAEQLTHYLRRENMFKKIPALMLLCAIPWIIGMTKPVRAEYIGINELQSLDEKVVIPVD